MVDVDISVQVWDVSTVAALALEVERYGSGIRALGDRGATSAVRAHVLAAALRAAGNALAYVDEDDADAIAVVVERLDALKLECESFLTLWRDDEITRQYDISPRRLEASMHEEETTVVRPRIIAPKRAGLRSPTV